jgi:hypothetical protein
MLSGGTRWERPAIGPPDAVVISGDRLARSAGSEPNFQGNTGSPNHYPYTGTIVQFCGIAYRQGGTQEGRVRSSNHPFGTAELAELVDVAAALAPEWHGQARASCILLIRRTWRTGVKGLFTTAIFEAA